MKKVRSYVSQKIQIQQSPIHGLGMFAIEHISEGEIVFIKGGHVLRRQDVFASGSISSYLPIDDDYVLGAADADEEEGIKLYVNHSCNPNCGVRGEITFVAMRDISPGEEITIDYAMVDNEDYEFVCRCGSKNCRGKVTGFDWKLPDLQQKYRGFFSRYLVEKMKHEQG